ncbi:MAG: XRE family transcriptional regulator [Candidatus Angelobacter sp.]
MNGAFANQSGQSGLFADSCRKFNREMLILARESRGLTQIDLAEAVGMKQAALSKIENGLRDPNELQISAFSKYLGYTDEFFYLGEQIQRFGSGCTYHRARQKAQVTEMRRLLGIINVRRIQVSGLLGGVELTPDNEFIRLDVDENGSPAEIARAVRAFWKLPPGPVQNLTRAIEDAGGIVLRCDFGTRDVDALSQFLSEGTPLFLANATIPQDRLRFTLAHELAHITMHHFPNDEMEKEADLFAAEFLMPADEIRADLYDVTLPKLAALKGYWKVSMNALLKRAGDLETITPRKRQSLWTQMGKYGYRRHEPVELPQEEPTLLAEMVNTYRNDLGYTSAQLSLAVNEAEDRIEDVYLPRRFPLKAINSRSKNQY